MTYDTVIQNLAAGIDDRCSGPLSIAVIDGIPAGGKSSLTESIREQLVDELGRPAVTVENDWFIARSIRSPLAVVWGLGMALTGGSLDDVERRLLDRFLDDERLGAFQDELEKARRALRETHEVVLKPEGAFWNLHEPRPWSSVSAADGLSLPRGGIVLIEGTLTAATYAPRFPELTRVLVQVPPEVARSRFINRNQDPTRRRNRAFSALALTDKPFEIASDMLNRHRDEYDFEVDLEDFDGPRFRAR